MANVINSFISKKELSRSETIKATELREGIYNLIEKDFPGFNKESAISIAELNNYRKLYLKSLVEEERGELAVLDKEVFKAIQSNSILSENVTEVIEDDLTLGQKVADKIADVGGSWTFIISFFTFLGIWIVVNVYFLNKEPFDPYPFILLNLILSCLASIQAPIIMMSQNRQEQKDRIRGEHDYKINLKAELEIRLLHEKLDHLIVHQNKRLLEIQELQADYLQDLIQEIKRK